MFQLKHIYFFKLAPHKILYRLPNLNYRFFKSYYKKLIVFTKNKKLKPTNRASSIRPPKFKILIGKQKYKKKLI